MKPRKWDGKTKPRAVLEGIKGRKVAEICNDYQISQAQYYQWREQFFCLLNREHYIYYNILDNLTLVEIIWKTLI